MRPGRDLMLPACVLLAIIFIDHATTPGVTITPICNFLAMGIIALYLQPRLMYFWAACFTLSSFYMLMHPTFSAVGKPDYQVTDWVRSAGAVAGAIVALLLCLHRWKAVRGHEQLVSLVKRLPVPFVLSDKDGTLLYVSDDASKVMNIPVGEAVGQSYFSMLLNQSDKGAAIQKYVALVDSMEHRESSIELKLKNNPEKSWNGILTPVDLQLGRCLITVLAPANGI